MAEPLTRIDQAEVRTAHRRVKRELRFLAIAGGVMLAAMAALYSTEAVPFSEASPYFISAYIGIYGFGVGALVLSAAALYVARAMTLEARRQNRISSSV